ncbi:MAG: diphosphomevalonate decarboxylase, partial [Chloroflexi bacterium]|nr:diphosphomevalonate decarboxylase [Chloroflexota bacterium]
KLMISTAAAAAHPNIAFIKYWGNQDDELRIPSNGSLSMNLNGLETKTTVSFDTDLEGDHLILNDQTAGADALARVSRLLDRIRKLGEVSTPARVTSENNFPTGTGIASSASAFAALTLAAATALGLCLTEKELSQLARTGSGSASRSVPGGFVEWQAGMDHDSSFATSLASPEHWDLVDFIVLISREHKKTGSSRGHLLAESSPLQAARVGDAPRRLDICRKALLEKDFEIFAEIVEQDSNLMHGVMMTSTPPLYYWQPGTLEIIQAVQGWRKDGLKVCFTIDAGPNVHLICPKSASEAVKRKLSALANIKSILKCTPGGPASLLEPEISGV